MIRSMTAFARAQDQADWGSLVCEMRSINHRFLEISLHLPDMLRFLEMPIRESIRQFVKRGKIECSLRYQPSPKAAGALFSVNTLLAQELCHASETITAMLKHPGVTNPSDILRFPGVLETKEADMAALQAGTMRLIEKTLHELIASRTREGEELKKIFFNKMDAIRAELVKVRERLPHTLQESRDKLLKRFHDAKLELDPTRLEQEMVMFAQKIDIVEEIDRTETHLSEMRRVLEHSELMGRRLDFLLQELNREANTMGSKSVDPTVTHAAVEMKVLIEQIREQVQNIE